MLYEVITTDGFRKKVNLKLLLGQRASIDVVAPDGEILVKANRKFTKGAIRKIEERNNFV